MDYIVENKMIAEYIRELKLPCFREFLDFKEQLANEGHWTYRHFLFELMKEEYDRRIENRKTQRIKRACFPEMKYLQELDRDALPPEGKTLLPELETLKFIKECRNIVMYGNPGTGKTHTAIGLGVKACLEGYSVYFASVPHLLTEIREAQTQRALKRLQDRFLRYDLVICDEFGYISLDKEGGEQLFNHLSLRAGKKSTITTTNLPFIRWDEIIKDKALCSALVDRLCHKAYLVNMSGPSYRVLETKKLNEK